MASTESSGLSDANASEDYQEAISVTVKEDVSSRGKRKRVTTTTETLASIPKAKKVRVAKSKITVEVEKDKKEGSAEPPTKVKRPRKTKEQKEAEMLPLALRTEGLRMFIGAHVSGAGGVQNSIGNATHIGANAFALFLKSQRKWDNPALKDEHRDEFIHNCSEHKFESSKHVVPHGSYLVNLAQAGRDKATQSYNSFIDDLKRCDSLGIKLYNFHPGNSGSNTRESSLSRIADALNRAHKETQTVKPLLENMAGTGNVIGSTFEDLRDIIQQVEDKSRIGVCLDTCHSFAAGYDLRSPEAFRTTLEEFDRIVGMQYLSALHLNDSKAPFQSHRDLHQNIGLGFLGLRAFHNIMNEKRFEDIPMVLETPIETKDSKTGKMVEDKSVWAREIKLLESLIGMDAEEEEFRALEKELADKGKEERAKLQAQFNKKKEKEKKTLGKEKGQKVLSFNGKSKKGTKGKEMLSDDEGDSDER